MKLFTFLVYNFLAVWTSGNITLDRMKLPASWCLRTASIGTLASSVSVASCSGCAGFVVRVHRDPAHPVTMA